MDFGLVSSLVRSNSATAASNNGGGLASETNADANKLRLYGFSFLNKDDTSAEDDLPPSKAARIGGDVPNFPSRECNNGGDSTQNMLSFSSPDLQLLSLSPHNASVSAFPFVSSSSGYSSCGGLNGPFTPSQWMELEHQALIYKYITANVPIPSYLLIPIRKALESSGLSCFSLLTPNARFHLGLSKSDPEPGRCRRTDGKKWRCSREAVADQKYCERHINRGRHRSRKPVEGHHQPTPAKTSCLYTELGSVVCSDSLLSRKLGDERRSEWPRKQQSIEATTLGMSMGGPLGEALSIGTKGLNLENRSPLDGVGLMLPSLPAL